MKIGIPKEVHAGEKRVATTPDVAKQLIKLGFEIVIEGAGFVTNSVVKVDGVALATTFDGPRKLRARISSSFTEAAVPDRFRSPGPYQNVGIFGDRSLSITVFNPPPTGGESSSIALIVESKWHSEP